MNSTFLALLNFVVDAAIFKRMFARSRRRASRRSPSYAKRHPVVLVPSHRSYFDFLILSLALLRAPSGAAAHRGAREHGASGPSASSSGARAPSSCARRFDDPLYKEVFRAYVELPGQGGLHPGVLHRGRALAHRQDAGAAPRHALLERRGLRRQQAPRPLLRAGRDHLRAARRGELDDRGARGRREEAREHARPGARAEVPAAPLRQRVRELRRADLARRRRSATAARCFARGRTEADEPERRAFVEQLGNELVERINWAMVANSTSVVAARAARRAAPRHVPRRAHAPHARDASTCCASRTCASRPRSPRDEPDDYADAIAFLLRADLIRSAQGPARRDPLLRGVAPARPRRLPQRHLPLPRGAELPGAPAAARRGAERELREDLALLARPLLRRVLRAEGDRARLPVRRVPRLLRAHRRARAPRRRSCAPPRRARPYFAFLAEQTRGLLEAYYATFSALLAAEGAVTAKQLEKLAAEQFERAELLGEVRRREGVEPGDVRQRARPADAPRRARAAAPGDGEGRPPLRARAPPSRSSRRCASGWRPRWPPGRVPRSAAAGRSPGGARGCRRRDGSASGCRRAASRRRPGKLFALRRLPGELLGAHLLPRRSTTPSSSAC